jgi:DNA repair exonuclease SbcCD nuclease subunit
MERTKVKKMPDVTAILCGDIHLREDQPICRTDDFWSAQWRKLDFISDLQKQYQCPVWCSGDLFDHWKPSPMLLSEASKHLPENFFTVYGQHDLPQHSIDLAHKCGAYNLMVNGKVSILQTGHWNTSLDDGRTGFIVRDRQATIQHITTYQGKLPWPGCTSPMAASLLRKYPQFDLIVTGDNHKPFVEEYKGRLLVNVGSMMRSTADQINYKPCVWLWYAETNTVKPVYLPIEEGVISREHLEVQEQRESRIDAFINRLNTEWEASLSFEENLEVFAKQNNIRKSVMEIIYKALE